MNEDSYTKLRNEISDRYCSDRQRGRREDVIISKKDLEYFLDLFDNMEAQYFALAEMIDGFNDIHIVVETETYQQEYQRYLHIREKSKIEMQPYYTEDRPNRFNSHYMGEFKK